SLRSSKVILFRFYTKLTLLKNFATEPSKELLIDFCALHPTNKKIFKHEIKSSQILYLFFIIFPHFIN
ncbi:hypothetical protein, partial [Enterococcus faecalis]|uniref:hypothetical protein n=1 Tax=Enterococcus faecalis TaxID=1351 RepID=UPI0019D71807